jgi:hypothetical protein
VPSPRGALVWPPPDSGSSGAHLHPRLSHALCLPLPQGLLAGADDEQVRLMEERVIVTDYYDNCIGAGSKKESAWPRSPAQSRPTREREFASSSRRGFLLQSLRVGVGGSC